MFWRDHLEKKGYVFSFKDTHRMQVKYRGYYTLFNTKYTNIVAHIEIDRIWWIIAIGSNMDVLKLEIRFGLINVSRSYCFLHSSFLDFIFRASSEFQLLPTINQYTVYYFCVLPICLQKVLLDFNPFNLQQVLRIQNDKENYNLNDLYA